MFRFKHFNKYFHGGVHRAAGSSAVGRDDPRPKLFLDLVEKRERESVRKVQSSKRIDQGAYLVSLGGFGAGSLE